MEQNICHHCDFLQLSSVHMGVSVWVNVLLCKICYPEKQKLSMVTTEHIPHNCGYIAFKWRYSRNCLNVGNDCLWFQSAHNVWHIKICFRTLVLGSMRWDKLVNEGVGKMEVINEALQTLFVFLFMIRFFFKYELP